MSNKLLDENQKMVILGLLWNIKVLLQSFLVGSICAVFIILLVYFSSMSMCNTCLMVLESATSFPLYFSDFLIGSFVKDNYFSTRENNIDSSLRLVLNPIFVSIIFYLVSLRARFNIKTIHLVSLTILVAIFISTVMYSIVIVLEKQKGLASLDVIEYLIMLVLMNVVFVYVYSIKFRSKIQVTVKEVLLTLLLNVLLVTLVIFVLIGK